MGVNRLQRSAPGQDAGPGTRREGRFFSWLGTPGRVRLAVLAGGLLVAGGSLAGLDGFLSARSAVDVARSENRELAAREKVLRDRAFDLAMRLPWAPELPWRNASCAAPDGRSWGGRRALTPPGGEGSAALLAWLLEQEGLLEALGDQPSPGWIELGRASAATAAGRTSGAIRPWSGTGADLPPCPDEVPAAGAAAAGR